jgi:hypothetical protein
MCKLGAVPFLYSTTKGEPASRMPIEAIKPAMTVDINESGPTLTCERKRQSPAVNLRGLSLTGSLGFNLPEKSYALSLQLNDFLKQLVGRRNRLGIGLEVTLTLDELHELRSQVDRRSFQRLRKELTAAGTIRDTDCR